MAMALVVQVQGSQKVKALAWWDLRKNPLSTAAKGKVVLFWLLKLQRIVLLP